jgi:2-keto-4-pentenoate hydratase/2-oxohepta-3-ene-1,7-dioic acid hydratase in catechol pathway
MKLGHLNTPDGPRLCVRDDEGRMIAAADLVPDAPATLDELIRGDGQTWVSRLSEALATASGVSPTEGPPAPALVSPSAIVAIGLNYLDHCREFGTKPPEWPIVFAKLPVSLAADGEEIVWREDVTEAVDWEAELGVVIGEPTRDVPVEEALDSVFGYTVVNDLTARDIQAEEQQWIRAKSLNGFCPLGPVVVTADEIPDPQRLRISSRVNGETMQESTTAEMIFTVAQLVSYLSRSFTLQPGDVIATGTPVGVGGFREPPIYLADGDVVEVEVERIGVLRNRCRVLAAVNA